MTDPIRARLDQFHTCQGDEHAEMWRAALRAVLDLHVRSTPDEFCGHCEDDWPCPTVRVIAEQLGATDV